LKAGLPKKKKKIKLDQGGEADYSPPAPAGSPSHRHMFGLGVIAQLVERLHGMQEVGGSIPPGSTNLFKDLAGGACVAKLPQQPTSNQL
jgi:hypothetical protein